MVNDYSKGKIYKIECNITGNVYIGSTTEPTIARRLAGHKKSYNLYVKGSKKYCSSFQILEKENYNIYLIENYPCKSRDELNAREGHYIKEYKSGGNCINQAIAGRTKEEYYKDNHEHIKLKTKLWYEENKEYSLSYKKTYRKENQEKLKEIGKKYKEDNKETIKISNSKYRENNKEKIKESQKLFRENNKEEISKKGKEKKTCECGGIFRVGGLSRHLKTNKHINFMNSKEEV